MQISKEELTKIRTSAKLGRDSDLRQAILEAITPKEKRKWQDEIEEWVQVTSGYFNVTTAYKELRAVTGKEMNAVRVALLRLIEKGVIERNPTKDGWYRRRECDLITIDWKTADLEPLDIKLTLGLDEMVNLYGGDIFVVAGESNAGKSAMCLDIVEKNMYNWDCHYFSSELGGPKIKKRISFHETPWKEWRIGTYSRDGKYHDVLFKEHSINIIDFLIMTENFWEVGTHIKNMHIALRETDSVAIICLQKDPNKEYGRGGAITEELASLYVNLYKGGTAKIIKLKDWKEEANPNGMVCDFRLVNGATWIQDNPWHFEESDSRFKPKWRKQ